jgi:hypothetical protein
MSWVRWGTPCEDTFLGNVQGKCEKKKCPGSSVYIFESVYGGIECCGCSLEGKSFNAKSTAGMIRHLRRHKKMGHHFPLHFIGKSETG